MYTYDTYLYTHIYTYIAIDFRKFIIVHSCSRRHNNNNSNNNNNDNHNNINNSSTAGLHDKIPAYNIFARGWVAQICLVHW